MKPQTKCFVLVLWILFFHQCKTPFYKSAESERISKTINTKDSFLSKLDSLRNFYHIPGLSYAVSYKDSTVVSGGLGFADLQSQRKATDSTTYRIASLTKPISSTILMKYVQQNLISLQDTLKLHIPGYEQYFSEVHDYVINNQPELSHLIEDYNFHSNGITVWHHLTHTSENKPGEEFRYNGFLFGILSRLLEVNLHKSFEVILHDEVIDKVHMNYSSASQSEASQGIIQLLATPYLYNSDQEIFQQSAYPEPSVNAAAGIVSNVLDLMKFDRALNRNILVDSMTLHQSWTQQTNNNEEKIPYGLGWFVQEFEGEILVWHYGWHPDAYSALYLKVPSKALTFILLSNGENLSAPFMSQGYESNVLVSPFAKLFIDHFATDP
ncbi:serine hydrolase domain-containing protein [Portibacter marinus]|uniref:serine hydrolase domain-containing protein n=1 Tax=Portibacter marinus TaxID=2898660 RepID=UPI001F27244C|nr:serine hydrolase domain-containing protein [Portibacter marinus]